MKGTQSNGEASERDSPSVSGLYYGEMHWPYPGRYALELRIDVDQRGGVPSPVLNCLSGDLYQIHREPHFRTSTSWRTYLESWIVDAPILKWSDFALVISGAVRYWRGDHPATEIEVIVPWRSGRVGAATVTFTSRGGEKTTYRCVRRSEAFREIWLELDACKSVGTGPILPAYDTHAHPERPADLPRRMLTLEGAYAEAGISLRVNPTHSIIDDNVPEFKSWTAAELHDAMETYFSQYRGLWPKWHIWCLVAGSFENPAVGGIMFDIAAAYGGAGVPPERQGCAIFRQHEWFKHLSPSPSSATEAAAMRKFLYTYVHEVGHVFNLMHSWDKGKPDALSWMNYDWRYDRRNGAGSYWSRFRLCFDDEELLHIRHGERAAVIMGGDPWATGAHAEAPPGAMVELLDEAPVELLVRSKGYFQFMEPVIVELRLRNLSTEPLELDTALNPEYGNVTIYVRRPNGKIVQYAPILCRQATPALRVLKPQAGSVEGEDRYSENVLLSYGAYGFCFDEPGEYWIRAVYSGGGEYLVPSNVHRIRVGRPFSVEEERLAQDYFTYEGGMSLYLNGSASPFLAKGLDTLKEIVERLPGTSTGAHLALVVSEGIARPFFRVEQGKLAKVQRADPTSALAFSKRALEQQQRDPSTFTNITYHRLRRARAQWLAAQGAIEEARQELQTLVQELAERGVNPPVLNEIQAYAKTL